MKRKRRVTGRWLLKQAGQTTQVVELTGGILISRCCGVTCRATLCSRLDKSLRETGKQVKSPCSSSCHIFHCLPPTQLVTLRVEISVGVKHVAVHVSKEMVFHAASDQVPLLCGPFCNDSKEADLELVNLCVCVYVRVSVCVYVHTCACACPNVLIPESACLVKCLLWRGQK